MNMKKCLSLSASILLALHLSGCQTNTDGKTVRIQLQMGQYTTAQYRGLLWKLLEARPAHASVDSLKMCFKRLRLKIADGTSSGALSGDSDDSPETEHGPELNSGLVEDNVDFNIGEVTVSSAGASLGTIEIPANKYSRIEFDLEPDCASGKSVQLTNGQGTFTSDQRITVKFDGNFDANVDGTLTLGVQTILDQLNTFNGGDLKVTLEAASGDLGE